MADDITTTTRLKKFQSIDEIFDLVACRYSTKEKNKVISNSGRRRWEALEPSKEIIKSELFMHQKLGLGWLIHRENPEKLPPFWVRNKQRGLYKNLLTDGETEKRPNPLRGGIFADDMGFGKTLTLISLISTDISRPFKKCKEKIASKKRKHSVLLEDVNVKNNVGFRRRRRTRPTLVICPPSVISMWEKQLHEHTRPGMLKVFVYDEQTHYDIIKVVDLQKYDIVLTTCNDKLRPCNRKFKYNSPIMKMEWFRVILDDAHMIIMNGICQTNQSLLYIKAKSRWVVTGMPVANGSYDLSAVMNFLRFQPFSDRHYWRTLVELPTKKGNENGISRLQNIVATISLRRLKGEFLVGLAPKIVETCFVELSAEDRVNYDQKEVDSQDVVQNYIRLGRAGGHYWSVLAIIQRLRQMCNDFTSCASEVLASYNIEDVNKNPELLRNLLSRLRDGEYCDCPICYTPLSDAIITCCGHIFCKICILKALSRNYPSCPMCRYRLSKSDLFSAPPEEPFNDGNKIAKRGTAYSSKVSALLKLLVESRNENPAAKCVVFSQFKKMLILLQEPLKAAGFRALRLDGLRIPEGKMDDVINEFNIHDSNSPASIVLLVDLTASESGIDLTGASRVYLLEPWLNPAVEEQAMDRVHRIGQEDLKIVRLITRNSIEERILELHRRKKNLDFGKNMKQREKLNEELRVIMGLCRSGTA